MQIWWIAALTMTMQGQEPALGIPAPPPGRRYVVDEAGVLDSAERRVVDSIAQARAKVGMPIYVLTIHSLAGHDASGVSFEAFSRRTFDSWRASRPGADRAAMLVIAVDDQEARLEAGPGWGRDQTAALQQVMVDAIQPGLSRNSLDVGIVLAAREMTWALEPPVVSTRLRDMLIAGLVVLGGAAVLGALRRRRRVEAVPRETPPTRRPAAEIGPELRVSQRMRAISDARRRSEKTASTITWLDTGEMPRFDGEPPPEAGPVPDADGE